MWQYSCSLLLRNVYVAGARSCRSRRGWVADCRRGVPLMHHTHAPHLPPLASMLCSDRHFFAGPQDRLLQLLGGMDAYIRLLVPLLLCAAAVVLLCPKLPACP